MAHVICRYDHYSCSMCNHDCWACEISNRGDLYDFRECFHLECDPGYFEKTSKSVEFDGRYLIVGKSFLAYIPDGMDYRPTADDDVIDYLEIDGIVYCGEKEPLKGETNGQNDMERESKDEGWEVRELR